MSVIGLNDQGQLTNMNFNMRNKENNSQFQVKPQGMKYCEKKLFIWEKGL